MLDGEFRIDDRLLLSITFSCCRVVMTMTPMCWLISDDATSQAGHARVCSKLRSLYVSCMHALISDNVSSQVGPVTSSVMNTAKRVVVIVASAIVFRENLERNAMIGSISRSTFSKQLEQRAGTQSKNA